MTPTEVSGEQIKLAHVSRRGRIAGHSLLVKHDAASPEDDEGRALKPALEKTHGCSNSRPSIAAQPIYSDFGPFGGSSDTGLRSNVACTRAFDGGDVCPRLTVPRHLVGADCLELFHVGEVRPAITRLHISPTSTFLRRSIHNIGSSDLRGQQRNRGVVAPIFFVEQHARLRSEPGELTQGGHRSELCTRGPPASLLRSDVSNDSSPCSRAKDNCAYFDNGC